MDDNGRTDGLRPSRAFLHFATRLAVLQRTHELCVPTEGYSSCFDGDGRTSRASLHRVTRLALTGMDDNGRFPMA